MPRQAFSPISDKDKKWIADHLEAAKAFVWKKSPKDSGRVVTLESLDRAWKAWVDSKPTETAEINTTINAVSVQFGKFLVDKAGFEWTIASDVKGTDLAVRALPGEGDIVVFPSTFISKRFARGETDFFFFSAKAIQDQVASATAAKSTEEAPAPKPWWKKMLGK